MNLSRLYDPVGSSRGLLPQARLRRGWRAFRAMLWHPLEEALDAWALTGSPKLDRELVMLDIQHMLYIQRSM